MKKSYVGWAVALLCVVGLSMETGWTQDLTGMGEPHSSGFVTATPDTATADDASFAVGRLSPSGAWVTATQAARPPRGVFAYSTVPFRYKLKSTNITDAMWIPVDTNTVAGTTYACQLKIFCAGVDSVFFAVASDTTWYRVFY